MGHSGFWMSPISRKVIGTMQNLGSNFYNFMHLKSNVIFDLTICHIWHINLYYEPKRQMPRVDALWDCDTALFRKSSNRSRLSVAAASKRNKVVPSAFKTNAFYRDPLSWTEDKWWKCNLADNLSYIFGCDPDSWSVWKKDKQDSEINHKCLQRAN